MQRGCSVDQVGGLFNHTGGVHRSHSGFRNVAESGKLKLSSSWSRIRLDLERLTGVREELCTVRRKGCSFPFPTQHLTILFQITPAKYNCLAASARSIVTSTTTPAHSNRRTPTHIHIKKRSSWLSPRAPLPSCSTRPRSMPLRLLLQTLRKRTAARTASTLAVDPRRRVVIPSAIVSAACLLAALHRMPMPLHIWLRAGRCISCIHRAVIPPSTPNLSIFFLLRNQHESNAPHSSRAVTFQQGLCNG